MADGSEPVSFDGFLTLRIQNTVHVMYPGLKVFQLFEKVVCIFFFEAYERWLLWKKKNEAQFDLEAEKAEEFFFLQHRQLST